MAFCKNCGTNLPEGATFCSSCGTPVQETAPQSHQTQSYQEPVQFLDADATDVQNNKVMAVLAYIGILVLVPLFGAKESEYARYHTKQGLLNCIASIVYAIASAIINGVVGAIFKPTFTFFGYVPNPVAAIISTVLSIGSLVFLAFAILGIVNAVQGKCKELPVLGKLTILDSFFNK